MAPLDSTGPEPSLDDVVRDTLEVVREALDMDVAYTTEFTEDEQVIRATVGDSESFSLVSGTRIALLDTYCKKMLEGEIENIVPDAAADPCVSGLAATTDSAIGAYVGVPIVLPTRQRVYGTLCCLSHESRPDLADRDLRAVRLAARLVALELERHRSDALQIYERVVQQLTVASYALDRDDLGGARESVDSALGDARELASQRMTQPAAGDLRAQ